MDEEANTGPPTHIEYKFGGGTILIFIMGGASAVISFFILSWKHGAASGEDNVGKEILMDTYITLHDGVVTSLMYASRFYSQKVWLEQGLRATESLITNVNSRVAFFANSFLQLFFKVQSNVAHFLLDFTGFTICRSRNSSLPE